MTDSDLWLPKKVTLEEAADQASFTVFIPTRLQGQWRTETVFARTEEGGYVDYRGWRDDGATFGIIQVAEGAPSAMAARTHEILSDFGDPDIPTLELISQRSVGHSSEFREVRWGDLDVRILETPERSFEIHFSSGDTELCVITASLQLEEAEAMVSSLAPVERSRPGG